VADKQQTNGELTLVGVKTTVEGKISTEGSIRIDGRLVGDIVAKANAVVGETGIIEGSVKARNVSVDGKVSGSIAAGEKVLLGAKSVVRGEVRAAKLVVDEGAIFDGECAMSAPTGATPDDTKRH